MLTRAGVPWEVATNLSPCEMLGYTVAAGEIEGGKFNWTSMDWTRN